MEHGPSSQQAEPTIEPSELSAALRRLGLSQYEERLRQNGFEDWEVLLAITETDMAELGFKLGDRRKLQRAIRERGSSIASGSNVEYERSSLPSHLPSEGLPVMNEHTGVVTRSSQQAARTARPYRRHPRPDPNAPRRPKTAYVLFGEHVRQDPALSQSSFSELAKETGRRWRELSPEERANIWETPATDSLRVYREELERYKQTDNHRDYRNYLKGFQQRQHNPGSTIPAGDSASLTPESPSFPPLPGSRGQEELKTLRRASIGTGDSTLDAQSHDVTSPVKSGMDEVRHILKELGISPDFARVTELPEEDRTAKAVEAFLHGTGSLLYFWNQEEARELVRSVYRPRSDSKPWHATEVFAMSAVGSYCDGEAYTMLVQENFLHLFICMLSAPSEISALRRMRLFTCLALCRFTTSVENARHLILPALDIGRETLTSSSIEAETSEGERGSWWKVFRSVVFLESWFSYNTSHESRVIESDLTLYCSSRSNAQHGPEVLQERVGELGQLAAYIALDLKTATQPKAAKARVHFETLDEWHRTLPPPMQLSRLSLSDPLSMNWRTKRSLLQLHVLFLGLFIEPHRNCLLDLAGFRLGTTQIDTENLEALKAVEEQCILAARQSARVASLLQSDNMIRSRCWVSVYTSYTGCTILLYSASQNLLGLFGEEAGQDLLYASSHLNALSLCSYNSSVAKKLYTQLQVIFNDIREVMVSPVYRAIRGSHSATKDVALVSLLQYGAVDGAEEVINSVVELTGRIMGVLQESLSF